MARQINLLAGLFAALIVGAASVGAPRAQDCPRGDVSLCGNDGFELGRVVNRCCDRLLNLSSGCSLDQDLSGNMT
jgi:hypothetical protein